VDSLTFSHSDVSQKLVKSGEINERLRLDGKKKTEQIEKYQRDTRYMEDRLRNLEIRGKDFWGSRNQGQGFLGI
jgi:hypothetical protein